MSPISIVFRRIITLSFVQRGLHMEGELGRESLEHELVELRKKQTQLLRALQLLFDLLEAYAPSWYTEEHHNHAVAALGL
jgi:hypothetical protein